MGLNEHFESRNPENIKRRETLNFEDLKFHHKNFNDMFNKDSKIMTIQ